MSTFTVGPVGHFSLAVRDPQASAKWFTRVLLLPPYMEADDIVSVGNDAVTIWFHRGKPSPETLGHISFQLRNRAELEHALKHLKKEGADLEDPGDEIGPQAEGASDIACGSTTRTAIVGSCQRREAKRSRPEWAAS